VAYPADAVTSDVVSTLLGPAYDRFGPADRSRHVELLRSVTETADVALQAEKGQGHQWTVTVCTTDCVGALAMITGLSASYQFDIRNADVFTLHFAQPPGQPAAPRIRRGQRRRLPPVQPSRPPGKILDVFQVQVPAEGDRDVWQRYRDDLAGLLSLLAQGHHDRARGEVMERVSEAARAAGGIARQLLPVSIEISNDASPAYTQLTIRSADTFGFLFAFTNALSVLNFNIERAEILTDRAEVCDTFWLTDRDGKKILADRRLQELRVAAALIKHFTHLLPNSPNPAQAQQQFNALTHQMISRLDWTKEMQDLESIPVLSTLAELMGVSRFLWEDFLRMQHENLFPVLLDLPGLEEPNTMDRLRESLQGRLSSLKEPAEQVRELNSFKDREMFRVDLRHITQRIGFRAFSEELSALAQVVVGEAAVLSYDAQESRFGTPIIGDGRPCPWCICALGKFGGRELGFGSDVELIIVYEAEGHTNGRTSVVNSNCFEEVVRTFLTTLTARREGIFEIDLRLRPYGGSSALATSLAGFDKYYTEGGAARQFERMALVKLRPVAGDPELGRRLVEARDAFVYPGRPLDLENVRHLRRRQAAELVPSGAVSAKYSPGGLVDIEYFVQAWQIAVGQRNPAVRVTNTLDAIERLAQGGHLAPERAQELANAYGFLRRLIDALRAVRGNAKDLTIPAADDREFAYLARRLDFDSPSQLEDAVATWMGLARAVWDSGVPFNP
jgi:glutamate-ammonia-ligase adenylyltransferase